ncbi:hypothetical protein BH09VER1_BH09VER1_05040 [soil metagenome]
MNTTKQFWALFKYQQSVNPFVIFMPVAFAIPLLTSYFIKFGKDYHPNLSLLLSNQSFYLVGIMAVVWLAPEILRKGQSAALWTGGTEFVLTRAVDRRIVARARLVFFYLLIMIVPLVIVGVSMTKPALIISEYDEVVQQKVLQSIPGSTAVPEADSKHLKAITIPNGEILVASWRLWSFLVGAVVAQALIYLVYPWKYRRGIVWALYIGIIFLPLLQMGSGFGRGKLTAPEAWFFSYTTHWPWFWVAGIAALGIGQMWSERRYAGVEQT